MTRQTRAALTVCSWIAITLAGCQVDHSRVTEEEGGVGLAVLAVREVPPDVKCIRVKGALSTRSLSQDFDVTPGSKDMLKLSGLSLGEATFWAEAFAVACGELTPNTPSTWTSTPADVEITPGEPVSIHLILQRSGTGTIDVDFRDLDAACTMGAVGSRTCNRCGTQTRSCGEDGYWQDWGDCTNQGQCVPGATRRCAVGNFAGTSTCSATCTWSECVLPVCPGERVCDPGASSRCGGTGTRICSSDCTWGPCMCRAPLMPCGATDTCYDLNIDKMHCGSCTTACQSTQSCLMGMCR